MRGDLDDALARLARRDQLQKRVSQGNDRTASAAHEIAAAVRQVVERHPGLTATVHLTHGGQAVQLTVGNRDGRVQVTVDGGTPAAGPNPPSGDPAAPGVPTAGRPPEWPPRGQPAQDGPAARLAELIRRDPSLLNGATEG
ncbi:hypothetical protein [Micromonospora sp. LOL_021]|uniref:hypothetical protein n=1 Tax=Micromonospora sp. LOL_021 TaxID=3345417 RepID=UPI003A87E007